MTGGKNFGKREILFRIMDHHWVNHWEFIYEFLYHKLSRIWRYRRSLVLNNTDLYKAVSSLFFFLYFLFKRKTICIYLSGGISLLMIFIQFCILYGIFLWIHVIFADRANGHQRTGSCIYEFISTFYLLCDHLAVADQAKLLCPKKRRNAL